jgi:hypothetical protein
MGNSKYYTNTEENTSEQVTVKNLVISLIQTLMSEQPVKVQLRIISRGRGK